MTSLVASLSTGKGTWGHVARLISDEKWESIFLITNEFGRENFKVDGKELNFILINDRIGLVELREQIIANLKDKLHGDVAINFISGSGKEHMAIISSILKLGIGLRLIALTNEGMKEI